MTEQTRYIDTHVHFWDPAALRYPWLESVPAINRAFLPTDLDEASAGLGLEQIVFVQADCAPEQMIEEAAWVTQLANDEPRISGIVAGASLERGEAVRPQLEGLSQYPLVKGIRRLIQGEGLGFATQPDFVRGVQIVAEFGFSFDICIFHPQAADAVTLVAQCPNVSFVLDHIGKPDIRNGVMEPWAMHMRELAAFPNVCCKLSGMVTEADPEAWTAADLRPYAEHIFDVFGADRVMFGGDWPVATLAASYRSWFETASAFIAELAPGEQEKVLRENAIRFYRLGD
ncbi:MAG: amidohydrolase family protein [Caldilineaceae bacterium]